MCFQRANIRLYVYRYTYQILIFRILTKILRKVVFHVKMSEKFTVLVSYEQP